LCGDDGVERLPRTNVRVHQPNSLLSAADREAGVDRSLSHVAHPIEHVRVLWPPEPMCQVLNGEHLDLPSGGFDAVLSTWTLCTIPNLPVALAEMRRVLKPGGTFHFVEHGHAPDPKVARWQARVEPLNKRLAGGCHITRQMPKLIEAAGFDIEHLDTYYLTGEPKIFGYTFEGRAYKR